ncbi:MAG: hypothetical protein GX639_01590 [Fibrobacter sp.]|nr:hypothetical protein [Fibrobacter sp.]
MDKYNSLPKYNSEVGKDFYKALSMAIGKPKDMETVGILSVVNLLTFLSEDVINAILTPMIALPLLINHENELVKLIVKLRLQEKI